jgi:hypothetical protein
MEKCFSCGGPLRTVREGLYRCLYCGQLNEEREGQILPRKMEVFPRIEKVREAAKEGVYEMVSSVPSESGIPRDMAIFIRRVAEALTPLKGYEADRGFVTRALRVRSQFRQELTSVFEGKMKLQDWYDKTRTSLGKRIDEMDEIIYNALEGLSDPEAIEMRMDFEQKLKGSLIK